jgi:hypothetical protein
VVIPKGGNNWGYLIPKSKRKQSKWTQRQAGVKYSEHLDLDVLAPLGSTCLGGASTQISGRWTNVTKKKKSQPILGMIEAIKLKETMMADSF